MIMESVSSSNIRAVGYDELTQTLRIEFNNGGIYDYPNIAKSTYLIFMSAGSLGSYHAAYIKHLPCRKIR